MKNNITPYNDKGKAHGYWEAYHYNGKILYKRFYVNNRRVGYEEFNYANGYDVLIIFHL